MLIIQIALGIVLAVLILSFWPYLLAGGAILLVGGIVLLVVGSTFGTTGLKVLAGSALVAWIVRDGLRWYRDPNRPRFNVSPAYYIAYLVANVLLVFVGGYLSRNAPELAMGSFRLREVVMVSWMVVCLGGLAALGVAEQVLARRRRERPSPSE